jgi:hypothetical protein
MELSVFDHVSCVLRRKFPYEVRNRHWTHQLDYSLIWKKSPSLITLQLQKKSEKKMYCLQSHLHNLQIWGIWPANR